MENNVEDGFSNLRCLSQQHKTYSYRYNRENLLNGESSPASVPTLLTQETLAETHHQTNQGTSIQGDATLCARLHNLAARHWVHPN